MTRIAVIGPGAVGTSIAYALSNRHDVTLLGRQNQTLTFEDYADQTTRTFTVSALQEVTQTFDVIFIAVKTHQLATVMSALPQLTDNHTTIILAQNGYGMLEQLKDYRAYQAVVYVSGQKKGSHVTHFRDYKLHIQSDIVTEQLAQIFSSTKLELVLEPHIQQAIWYKLIVNLGINTVTALGRDTARVLKDERMAKLCRQLLVEGKQVARAEGIHFDADFVTSIMNIYAGYPDEMGTSMYYDTMNQQPLEVDAIQGYIYQRAKAHQLDTPHLETIYTLLAYQNQSRL
ncbi:oxidoreductase [Staphylococcus intermedius]|uniref:2-dehydropantoate 2-reductase n=1 Tax=Staphylococcus intermedius NCTC 11048 TaxID=1141106 RepID=A0A380G5S0_STAIN|nr:oxidoreductase [Staphylococcus intermedius]PCF64347.1 2-dehydropantoate 2-reductase [Staphylococcus intermedius]PCF79063.1 2-dehydropantoate 2-reductase [Staphylococcus intermedius]PCF80035.1 2-dehydropantoate 2-reductase [Staphylococcus intermedius]PCF89304.1 2-dehydropantoate 2-reductase [Staphylococcus intermedius]PNZ53117.1 2-dehydropantoate 2-reductase [Staphylococcus intermedius NCTC 11048]